jgi:hypothetical protein
VQQCLHHRQPSPLSPLTPYPPPLPSPQGTPLLVSAVPGKPGQAEMTTDQGAIYVTDNAAYTWTAAVQETVDATLNRTVSSGITGASFYEGSFSNVARWGPGAGGASCACCWACFQWNVAS